MAFVLIRKMGHKSFERHTFESERKPVAYGLTAGTRAACT